MYGITLEVILRHMLSVAYSINVGIQSFFSKFIKSSSGGNAAAQTQRLEAFVDAFPGEYCGLSYENETVAYSKGFCDLLGLNQVRHFEDIQNQLSPGDSAALEGLYTRLVQRGESFSINATTIDDKPVKIFAAHGKDMGKNKRVNVFWVEDSEALSAAAKPKSDQQERMPNAAIEDTILDNARELLQMQTALDSIPRPLWLRDNQQNLVWCNSTYCDYLEMSLSDILSDQIEIASLSAKRKNSSDIPPGPKLAKLAIEHGEAAETNAHGIFKGKRLLMKLSELPLNPLGMTLGIAYNITREEELETQLKRYEASNKDLLGQLRSAIAIFNAEQTLEFYNDAFAQLWDLEDGFLNKSPTLGEIMERLRENRRLPEQTDFRDFKKSWIGMFTDLIEPTEDMLFLPDGSTYRMLAVPHSLGGLMMNFEDVTGRLALESSYNTLIAVQRETLDNLAEGVAVFGGDGRLKLWNPAFAQLWNMHGDRLQDDMHVNALVDLMQPFFDQDEWDVKRRALIAQALDRDVKEGRMARKDGSLLEYAAVPLPDGGVLISYSDITDKVQVENALREKNTALEAAERLKVDFLANVSYQLRTPLNAIMGFTEILDQEYFGPLNERQKEYTHDMKEASERLVTLINDILDLSTLEAGYMTLNREDTDIYAMISGIGELMADWARKEQIEISVVCKDDIGEINIDEKRMKQAVVNIIRNSITFTPAGGKISLESERKKDGLYIRVHDNGIGVTEEDRMRIFEPFERAQSGAISPKLSRSGAGLGLSLVKNIVSLHNGEVTLDSTPGEGTTITIVLPFLSMKTSLKLSA